VRLGNRPIGRSRSMTRKGRTIRSILASAGALAVAFLAALPASTHCDTLDGPVALAAQAALEKGDVTPVLKWVRSGDEPEIRAAFARTLLVRGKGPEAKALADTWFLETLVRIHRAGEGAPFTGLKPVGSPVDPAVRAADDALAGGSVDELLALVTKEAASGIRKRFQEASERKKHAEHNVVAGRAYVAAYVDLVHFVERLYQDATGTGGGHAEAPDEHEHQRGHE